MIAKGSGYVRGNRQASAARLTSHFKYTEHRSRDLEHETRDDRRIFSKEEDVVSRRDAVGDVMEHTSTSRSLTPSRPLLAMSGGAWISVTSKNIAYLKSQAPFT